VLVISARDGFYADECGRAFAEDCWTGAIACFLISFIFVFRGSDSVWALRLGNIIIRGVLADGWARMHPVAKFGVPCNERSLHYSVTGDCTLVGRVLGSVEWTGIIRSQSHKHRTRVYVFFSFICDGRVLTRHLDTS
jgi:hypothetical protein